MTSFELDLLSRHLELSPEETAALLPTPLHSIADLGGGPDDCPHLPWWLAAGEPVLVLIGADVDTLAVAVPRIEWNSQTPVMVATSCAWRVLDEPTEVIRQWFRDHAASALRSRTASFRRCHRCGDLTPPEHRLGAICHSCAQADGVVF